MRFDDLTKRFLELALEELRQANPGPVDPSSNDPVDKAKMRLAFMLVNREGEEQ